MSDNSYEKELAAFHVKHPQWRASINRVTRGRFWNGSDGMPDRLSRMPDFSIEEVTAKRGDIEINNGLSNRGVVATIAGELKQIRDRWHKNAQSVFAWMSHESDEDISDEIVVVTRRGSKLIALPGGKIEPGETAKQALVREVLEETGIELDDLRWTDELFSGIAYGRRVVVYPVQIDQHALGGSEDGITAHWVKATDIAGRKSAFRRFNKLVLEEAQKHDRAREKQTIREMKQSLDNIRSSGSSRRGRDLWSDPEADRDRFIRDVGYYDRPHYNFTNGGSHPDECRCGSCNGGQ